MQPDETQSGNAATTKRKSPSRGEIIATLRTLHDESYDIVYAANGLIRYTAPFENKNGRTEDPAGAILRYDNRKRDFARAVDDARDLLRRIDEAAK